MNSLCLPLAVLVAGDELLLIDTPRRHDSPVLLIVDDGDFAGTLLTAPGDFIDFNLC